VQNFVHHCCGRPNFCAPKGEKCLERAEKPTETLATQTKVDRDPARATRQIRKHATRHQKNGGKIITQLKMIITVYVLMINKE